jgi:hypothetical protein
METQPSSDFEEFVSGSMSEEALYFLESAGKWAKFMAVLGFIAVGFMILGGLGIMAAGSMLGEMGGASFMPVRMLGPIYLVLAGIYFLPVLYLWRFAAHATNGLAQNRPEALTESMRYLRAHYRFLGIMTIGLIGMYIVGIAVTVIFGVSASM